MLAQELIPNVRDKIEAIENKWKDEGWYNSYPALRGFVEYLAEDYDLFKWLFEEERFHNCQPWHLPQPYFEAYEEFLTFFFCIDDL